MATAAAPASSLTAHPAVAAAVKSATLPLQNIWAQIMGMFSSAAVTGLGGAFATLAPTMTLNILGGLGVAAGLISLIAHAYGLVTGVSATNNATIIMAEQMLQQLEMALGGKALVFDNSIPKPGAA